MARSVLGSSIGSDQKMTTKTYIVTTIGLFKAVVGSGVLSMPKALADTGIVLFVVLLFVFSLLASYSSSLVAKTLDLMADQNTDPAKIGEFCLGRFGKILTLVMCFLDPWGATMAFLSTVAETVRPLLQEDNILGEDSFWTHDAVVVGCLAVMVYPLTLYTRITELGWVNVFGTTALLAFFLAVLVNTIQHGHSLAGEKLAEVSTDSVVALTVVSFAYDGCQLTMFPFYRDVPDTVHGAKSRPLIVMSYIANSLAAVAYLIVALLAYSAYKDDLHHNVLTNLGMDGIGVTIKLAFSGALLLSVPITLIECSNVIREHLIGDHRMVTNMLLNLFLVGSSAAVAVLIPNMYVAFAYVGATSATCWTLVLPPLWYIYTVKRVYRVSLLDDTVQFNEEDPTLDDEPLVKPHHDLAPPPTKLDMACAWALLILGCSCLPIFMYSTVLSQTEGSNSGDSDNATLVW
eukprot:TRINITY_DN27014_c0_g1_i1.p1 TRINITY_DN27014_c0_g1~~TRINITY_DN27014_c0_g1_i1.p1  ORF type:complete len:460 (+),score=202.52 TRINITY_DN27014_c0_g1_i1:135-1514(+)